MDLLQYFSVLFVLFANGDAGGHGEKHHDHVKLHVPEFIHHDHHTKVITIHHHHKKPKEETHYHHIQLPKPQIPQEHHYQHQKTSTLTVSKGHTTHHGSHGKHGSHSHHHNNDGHRARQYKHHDTPSYDPPPVSYDSPAFNYAPPGISHEPPKVNYPSPSYGNDYKPFVPSVPSSPQIHGVVHTFNQVKAFGSSSGSLPKVTGNTASHGYEVTEQGGENDEDDVFTAVNTLSQTYPGTYGFIRNAAPSVQNDAYSQLSQHTAASLPIHNPFAAVQQSTSYGNVQDFSHQGHQTISSPNQDAVYSGIQPSQFTSNDATDISYDESGNAIIEGLDSSAFLSSAESFKDDAPVHFNQEAGIQQY